MKVKSDVWKKCHLPKTEGTLDIMVYVLIANFEWKTF